MDQIGVLWIEPTMTDEMRDENLRRLRGELPGDAADGRVCLAEKLAKIEPPKPAGPGHSYGESWESQPTYESSLPPDELWGKDPWSDEQ